MSLAYCARNAASVERMSRRIPKEGITGKGSRIWMEGEDRFLQANYPNFELIREHLSHTAPAKQYGHVAKATA